MKVILLSGGSGKRLWPLSNDNRSKQFIKILKREDGTVESMVQRMYRGIVSADKDADVTVATSRAQVAALHSQIGENITLSVEPCRKDTFPAIVLAAVFLHEIKHVDEDQLLMVCPVDPYVEADYFVALKNLEKLALSENDADICVIGAKPTYPAEKYGYILPKEKKEDRFYGICYEKPSEEKAKEYIAQGVLWNAGVFVFKMSYILKKAHEKIDFTDYEDLYEKYESLNAISFDKEILESEEKVCVLEFSGPWKDLGTWNTLTEAMDDSATGKAVVDSSCENVNVLNELDVPVVCMGLKNVVVAASAEGVFVSDKEASSYNKPVVDKIDQQVMFADKSWGSFRVLDVGPGSMTNKITVLAGRSMNYHSHAHRDEIWSIVSGRGTVIVDGMKQPVSTGDVVTMAAGCRHTVMAETELCLIEVQIGDAISVHDKTKYKLDI